MDQKVVFKDEIGLLGDAAELEKQLYKKGHHVIAGVDEAGRGPLSGPVVAAAVIFPDNEFIPGLQDSKKLSPSRRDLMFDRIISSNAIYAVGIVDNEIIDRINILRASLRAMTQAVFKLRQSPTFVLVDGNQTIPHIEIEQAAIIGGDGLCPSISAASIIAKVTRDRIMDHYAKLYSDFSFAKHKGYPTPAHLRELKLFGPTPIHRKSFKPVAELISQTEMSMA